MFTWFPTVRSILPKANPLIPIRSCEEDPAASSPVRLQRWVACIRSRSSHSLLSQWVELHKSWPNYSDLVLTFNGQDKRARRCLICPYFIHIPTMCGVFSINHATCQPLGQEFQAAYTAALRKTVPLPGSFEALHLEVDIPTYQFTIDQNQLSSLGSQHINLIVPTEFYRICRGRFGLFGRSQPTNSWCFFSGLNLLNWSLFYRKTSRPMTLCSSLLS